MILDGKKVAQDIFEELKRKIASHRIKPGLAVVLVGEDPASKIYVTMKEKSCRFVGMESVIFHLPASASQKELLKLLNNLNLDKKIDGILVQQPLPKQIDPLAVTLAIDPAKDVDGFHPLNVGKMLLGMRDCFLPCTPKGIVTLLQSYNIPVEGSHIVIVGRSNIVGKPLAALLMQKSKQANATVTVVHSKSKDIASLTKQADILIAAIGKPHFIKADMVKSGAVVIDVGISRQNGELVGDVDFAKVEPLTKAITPVPGGVGPMTRASLLENTYQSFKAHKRDQ